MMRRALVFASVLLGLPTMAADYYLSNEGDDLQPGTSDHPWATIGRAASALKPGDTLHLRGGDRFQGPLRLSGGTAVSSKTLALVSDGGSPAEIDVSTGPAIKLTNLGHVLIRQLSLKGGGESGPGNGIDIHCDRAGGVRLGPITVEDVEATGFANAGIAVTAGTNRNSGSGYDGVTISRCVAEGNGRCGILVRGDLREPADGTERRNFSNVTITDCVAKDNPGDPQFLENHSGDGILIGSVDGGMVERCVAFGNGAQCNCQLGGPVGIWAYASRHVTIRQCASFQNRTGTGTDGGGFDLDGGCEDCVIESCFSAYNDGGGYLLFDFAGAPFYWKNNVVRSCLSIADGRKGEFGGIVVGGKLTGAEVALNAVVQASEPPVGRPACLQFSNFDFRSRGLRFENNVLISTGKIPVIAEAPAAGDTAFAGNLCWPPAGQPTWSAAR